MVIIELFTEIQLGNYQTPCLSVKAFFVICLEGRGL